MIIPAVCLLLTVYSPLNPALPQHISLLTNIMTLGIATSSLTVAGVSCNQLDISPQNAGTIFGIGNTASCLAGFIAVPLTGYLHDFTHSWDVIFLLFVGHYLVGALAWWKLASDQPLQLQPAV